MSSDESGEEEGVQASAFEFSGPYDAMAVGNFGDEFNGIFVCYRPSMSYGTMVRDARFPDSRDVTVATPEELVRKLGGTKVINKVIYG